MKRSYYICSLGEPGKDYDEANVVRCITHSCFILHPDNQRKGPIDKITPDDILILKYRDHFIAYGRAASALRKDKDHSNGDGWSWRIDVNFWITGNHTHKYGIRDAQESGSNYDTVRSVDRSFALQKIEEIGFPF